MRKTAAIGYGLAAYMIFRATFLYHIGFIAGIVVPTRGRVRAIPSAELNRPPPARPTPTPAR